MCDYKKTQILIFLIISLFISNLFADDFISSVYGNANGNLKLLLSKKNREIPETPLAEYGITINVSDMIMLSSRVSSPCWFTNHYIYSLLLRKDFNVPTKKFPSYIEFGMIINTDMNVPLYRFGLGLEYIWQYFRIGMSVKYSPVLMSDRPFISIDLSYLLWSNNPPLTKKVREQRKKIIDLLDSLEESFEENKKEILDCRKRIPELEDSIITLLEQNSDSIIPIEIPVKFITSDTLKLEGSKYATEIVTLEPDSSIEFSHDEFHYFIIIVDESLSVGDLRNMIKQPYEHKNFNYDCYFLKPPVENIEICWAEGLFIIRNKRNIEVEIILIVWKED